MIDPKSIVSYAQYNEDLILSSLLRGIQKGFYVDVGASYPDDDSVTKHFYEQGWRGINIEPVRSVYQLLDKARPKDININCGVGAAKDKVQFREYTENSRHSTFDVQQMEAEGGPYIDYTVNIRTLSDIFSEYKVKDIHFLKIDVEGYEYPVIIGNDWNKYRPYVVCLEANHMSKDWHKTMTDKKYRLLISDGLNEYYVADEHWELTDSFADKVVLINHFSLKEHQFSAWTKDLGERDRINEAFLAAQAQMQTLQQSVESLQEVVSLTLKGVPLHERIKRAAFGLTVDWVRFKKNSKD